MSVILPASHGPHDQAATCAAAVPCWVEQRFNYLGLHFPLPRRHALPIPRSASASSTSLPRT